MVEAWPILEPTNSFVDNWHIDAICEHLTACVSYDGGPPQLRKLVINIPPRCQKSLLVAVFFFGWVWTFWPEARFLYSSYADSLSIRDNLKCRRLITSKWYRDRFGDAFNLSGDQNQKTRFENDRTGYRIATGVGGFATGEGGDFIVADDPHKVQEAESEAVREGVLEWWFETMSTRGNNPETAVRIIVMQRVHQNDLTGAVLARELGYEHLMLPMRFEPDRRCVTSLGWQDPRTEEGELLWPARFPEEVVKEREEELGSHGVAGQFQQRPAPREGGIFLIGRIETVEELPADLELVRYWDKAASLEKGSAYSAGVLMGRSRSQGLYYVVDVVRGRWTPDERERTIKNTAIADYQRFRGRVSIWVEQEPGSGGKESAESTLRNLAGFDAHRETATGAKDVRCRPYAAQVEAGNVRLLAGAWNSDYLAELGMCPNGYWDQVDASSGAFNKLNLPPLRSRQRVTVPLRRRRG